MGALGGGSGGLRALAPRALARKESARALRLVGAQLRTQARGGGGGLGQ
jgi:hypothetical protein